MDKLNNIKYSQEYVKDIIYFTTTSTDFESFR